MFVYLFIMCVYYFCLSSPELCAKSATRMRRLNVRHRFVIIIVILTIILFVYMLVVLRLVYIF
jgi:hypothetical protein